MLAQLGRPYNFCSGDLDGDGDDEFNAVDADNGTYLFNHGDDPLTLQMPRLYLGCSIADYDGDGDLDYLGSDGSNSYIYLNQGNFAFAGGVTISANLSIRDPQPIDWDGDGDLDVFGYQYVGLGDKIDDIVLALNPGNVVGQWPIQILDSQNYVDINHVAAGDINGDGLIDYVVSDDSPDEIYVAYNQGNDVFGAPTPLDDTTQGKGPEGVVLGDIDGDGDLDIIGSTWIDDNIRFYNNGGGANPVFASSKTAHGENISLGNPKSSFSLISLVMVWTIS